jgi:hypothetical protein
MAGTASSGKQGQKPAAADDSCPSIFGVRKTARRVNGNDLDQP